MTPRKESDLPNERPTQFPPRSELERIADILPRVLAKVRATAGAQPPAVVVAIREVASILRRLPDLPKCECVPHPARLDEPNVLVEHSCRRWNRCAWMLGQILRACKSARDCEAYFRAINAIEVGAQCGPFGVWLWTHQRTNNEIAALLEGVVDGW